MKIHSPHRNHGCRVRDYTWRGYRCLSLENERLRTVVCPGKGCDILEFTYKPTDTECLYQSPWGLPAVTDRASSPLAEGEFRDRYPGGWYLMLPNGPRPCSYRGASYGFHGEATFLAWDADIITDDEAEVSIRCQTRLRRTPVVVAREMTLRAGSPTITLHEQIANESPQPIEVLWGHHPTFGKPLIEPGTRVLVERRSGRFAATVPEPDAGIHEFTRFDDLADGWYAVVNENRDTAFTLRWDRELFPVLGYWQLFGGGPDYPWYGSRHLAALEPCCDLPSLADAAAAGTAVVLHPGESRSITIAASALSPSQHPGGIEP